MAYINGKEILFSPRIGSSGGLTKRIGGTLTQLTEGDFEGLTRCKSYALSGCSQLVSVEMPNTILVLENNVFAGCTSLETVRVSTELTQIWASVFRACKKLKEIVLPSTLVQIGGGAFYDNQALTTVTINASTPPTLGTGVFEYCTALEKIIVPTGCADAYKAATNWSEYADYIVEE